jgi:lysophospholipid acyltransferase (LPLAT)-like uncharacterized protein
VKLRHPGLIGLAALLASWLLRFWMRTLRFRMVYQDGKVHPTDARVDPHIYAFWHESLLFPIAFDTRVTILISHHADGELIARVCKHLGGDVVRGSTSRGGLAGLMGMANKCRSSHLAMTPDGPRGPRRRFQVGTVLLGSLTGLPIVPCGLTFAPVWRAPSWDQMLVPWPWGAAYGVIGVPVHVPANLDRQALESFRVRIEGEMARLTAAAERWANEGVRPRASGASKERHQIISAAA